MTGTDRFSDAICGCCGRTATGYGYAPKNRREIIWTCDDPQCLPLAKKTYSMKQDKFTRLESLAAGKGGEEAWEFLCTIDKTDIAHLTQDEAYEFFRRVVAGYRKGLVALLSGEVAL